MSGRVHAGQRPGRADRDLLAVAEHRTDRRASGSAARRGCRAGRRRPSPPSARAARGPPGAAPLLVHVDGRLGEGGGDVSHRAGMVEVDVGDDDAGEIVRATPMASSSRKTVASEPALLRLDEAGLGFDQVAGRYLIPATELGVPSPPRRTPRACSRRALPAVPHRPTARPSDREPAQLRPRPGRRRRRRAADVHGRRAGRGRRRCAAASTTGSGYGARSRPERAWRSPLLLLDRRRRCGAPPSRAFRNVRLPAQGSSAPPAAPQRWHEGPAPMAIWTSSRCRLS